MQRFELFKLRRVATLTGGVHQQHGLARVLLAKVDLLCAAQLGGRVVLQLMALWFGAGA